MFEGIQENNFILSNVNIKLKKQTHTQLHNERVVIHLYICICIRVNMLRSGSAIREGYNK